MRTIDADGLGVGRCNPDVMLDPAYAAGWNALLGIINSAPTIDPVHAAGGCYCWECKWARKVDDREPKYRCVNICRDGCTQWLGSNDFCNYGEPREAQDG